ncbi:hypothetical protein M5D96_014177 [Drosophila gunungcola]|uniref:Uncharacterized protein n=1 Tax=Drosophila gunungcola TaxID=103775 RepID=A0A9P9YAN9_9MUSC|nr:hypothetical protein M5D96_014177 [Drosophila gunungcola]
MSCRPGGAWMGLRMVIFRLPGGARKPPLRVSWVRMPADEELLFISMVSADLEMSIEEDCCRPSLLIDSCMEPPLAELSTRLSTPPTLPLLGSSICVEALRMHFSGRPEPVPPTPAAASECADVERTNCRTCFWWAVKKP